MFCKVLTHCGVHKVTLLSSPPQPPKFNTLSLTLPSSISLSTGNGCNNCGAPAAADPAAGILLPFESISVPSSRPHPIAHPIIPFGIGPGASKKCGGSFDN